ncbi:MAG: DUF2157 domain-containing protein, partial [Chloroflexi bacterium]|nr:DUF2157 domain-containing protein [Chloroflexota bacterium]
MRDDLNGVLQTAVQSYFARGRRVARGWTPGPAPHSERIRAGLLGQDLALLERAAVGDAAVSESEVEAAAGRVLDDLYRPLALDAPVLPPGFDDMPLGQALVAARAHAAGTAAAVALPAPEPEAPISPDTPSPGVPTAPRAGAAEWLLGESAIRGVLYLGGLLVTVAAAIFVAYNWGSFPGVLKVASIMATTAGVGALGYVLAATPLRAAGVTFIAIGSLLAPLNFSALQSYVLGPAGTPPEIAWLTGAVVCGAFYVITAHWLRNPLFSYAAALAGAAGVGAILSAVKAPENLWAPVGIAVVGLLMTGAHEADRGGAPDYVTTPFRRFALAAIVVLLFPLWVLGLDAPSSFNPNRNSLLIGQALAAALLLFH